MARRLTSGERAQAIAYCGFREPIGTDYLYTRISIAVLSVSLVGFGLFGLIFGQGAERVRAIVMLVAGVPLCWWGWRFYRCPVAPSDDADLAREVRHRKRTEHERDAERGPA